MFYGMASSEGLEDPLVLNDITPIKVIVDYKPDAKSGPYWHRYLMQIPDDEVKATARKFSKLMRFGWYSIFWDEKTVHVVFKKKILTLEREKNWKSEKYLQLREYAFSHGSEPKHFDFNERFRHYEKLLKEYNSNKKYKPHHVALTVNNVKETIQWYKENLGFAVTNEYTMYEGLKAILQLDEVRLELFDFEKKNQPLPAYRKDLMDDLHVIGTKHLCIEVDDLDKLVADFNKKGVPTRKIDTAGFGGRFTFIKDCNGILIELYQK